MRWERDGRGFARADRGFTLVEVIVAITLLMLVTIAATPLIVNGLQLSTDQQRQQAAVIVAQEAMEEVRARASGLTSVSPLVTGRHTSDVTAQFARLSGHPGIGETTPAHDSAASAGSPGAAIPIVRDVQRDGTDYTVETVIGACTLQQEASGDLRCLRTGSGSPMVRSIVIVTWTAGSLCSDSAAGYCSYQAMTLINLDTDLEWSDAN